MICGEFKEKDVFRFFCLDAPGEKSFIFVLVKREL